MRKIFLTGALAAGLAAAGALTPSSAEAMTISTPAMVGKAVSNNISDVAYRCHRAWTRWGWRRVCHWRHPYAGYGYYGGYYGGPYAYYGWRRPYYRRHYYRRYWW